MSPKVRPRRRWNQALTTLVRVGPAARVRPTLMTAKITKRCTRVWIWGRRRSMIPTIETPERATHLGLYYQPGSLPMAEGVREHEGRAEGRCQRRPAPSKLLRHGFQENPKGELATRSTKDDESAGQDNYPTVEKISSNRNHILADYLSPYATESQHAIPRHFCPHTLNTAFIQYLVL